MQIEHIANRQLLQIGEHLLRSHTTVAGKNGMGACTAHGEGTAQQMPHTPLQRVVSGAVVDGQVYADLRDLHISHCAVAGNVELAFVIPGSIRQSRLGVGFTGRAGCDGFVVRNGLLLCFQQGTVVCLLDDFFISSVDFRCVPFVDIVADDRI